MIEISRDGSGWKGRCQPCGLDYHDNVLPRAAGYALKHLASRHPKDARNCVLSIKACLPGARPSLRSIPPAPAAGQPAIMDVDDIERAHDCLTALVLGEGGPVTLTEDDRPLATAALDVLCWILRHEHNASFGSNLEQLGWREMVHVQDGGGEHRAAAEGP